MRIVDDDDGTLTAPTAGFDLEAIEGEGIAGVFLVLEEDVEGRKAAVSTGNEELPIGLVFGRERGMMVDLLLEDAQFLSNRRDFLEKGIEGDFLTRLGGVERLENQFAPLTAGPFRSGPSPVPLPTPHAPRL